MTLYMIHCGFYDEEISEGIYEFHVNIPVVAANLDEAKSRVRQRPVFQKKKMHIDGIEEIKIVDGHRIDPIPLDLGQGTQIAPHLHRDL